jgi:predicted TIM-barrel fold metal-dependent hydrolase
MVVDAHAHVFAAVSKRFPRDVHELFPAAMAAPVEALLAEMDRAGVDRAVLVPLTHHDEYLRHCLERLPGRFVGIGVQRVGSVDVAEYRSRRESVGLQGLRMFELGDPSVESPALLDSFPLLSEFARTGDKLWFYGGKAQMELLERVLDELPELTVVLNHLGYLPSAFHADEHGRPRFSDPYPAEGLEVVRRLARFPRVYILCTGQYAFTTAACPYDDLRPVTSALVDAYSPGRLLLGSDFPWIQAEPGYAETIEAVEAHFAHLSEADRAKIRGGNALELFVF